GEATPGLLAILHCVSAYPAPPEQANLSAIQSLKTRFGVETGYSDHTIGITAAIAAVAMGARIIEKHFTLANDYSDFRDHQLSADPGTMTELVERVRQIDIMLGDGVKAIQPNEVPIQAAVARSLAVNFDREAGDILLADDVSWVRCGNGVPYGAADPVGKRLTRKVSAGASLSDSDFE
ncbi:MAG TPA: hypothetical protein ENI77_08095, partial [Nitrospirae bacterium]|nr:hypothetical protein [Nitrospirota bacterium]